MPFSENAGQNNDKYYLPILNLLKKQGDPCTGINTRKKRSTLKEKLLFY
jgi:hypothetical protein